MGNLLKLIASILGGLWGRSSASPDDGGASAQGSQPATAALTPQVPEWFSLLGNNDDPVGIVPRGYTGEEALPDRGVNAMNAQLQTLYGRLASQCDREGFQIFITEGFRPHRRQAYLYSLGRQKLQDGSWMVAHQDQVVTKAKPGQSKHETGRAFDIAIRKPHDAYDPALMRKAGAIGRSCGLVWGGDWKGGFVDDPHFEMPA